MAVKTGVTWAVITISIVVTLPHWPAFGVNVYVVVPTAVVLITAGFQVPLIPLLEVVGNAGGVEPAQKAATFVNVGVNTGFDKMIPVKSSVVHPLICN